MAQPDFRYNNIHHSHIRALKWRPNCPGLMQKTSRLRISIFLQLPSFRSLRSLRSWSKQQAFKTVCCVIVPWHSLCSASVSKKYKNLLEKNEEKGSHLPKVMHYFNILQRQHPNCLNSYNESHGRPWICVNQCSKRESASSLVRFSGSKDHRRACR